MIYITGDCHGDWSRFSRKSFPQQREMTREDFVIVCGDFGIWHRDETEDWWMAWLAEKPFTVLFVDGNHENYDRLYGEEFPVVDFHGGKAHRIRENVYHLMRGYVFELCGKTFFAFGGASSHDVDDGILDRKDFPSHEAFMEAIRRMYRLRMRFRVNHESWWKEELPSQAEMDRGRETLSRYDYRVDYVISHCLPQTVVNAMGYHGADSLTAYFDTLLHQGLRFDGWYAGHYHRNDSAMGRFHVLYEDVLKLI